MLLRVRVTPNASRPSVTETEEGTLEVRVDARPEEGRANRRLVEILSKHLGVPRSRLAVVAGARSREKVVRVAP